MKRDLELIWSMWPVSLDQGHVACWWRAGKRSSSGVAVQGWRGGGGRGWGGVRCLHLPTWAIALAREEAFWVFLVHFYTCDRDQIPSLSFQLAACPKINRAAPPVISALFYATQTSRLTSVPEKYLLGLLRADSSRLLCSFLPSKHSPHFFLISSGLNPSTGVEVRVKDLSIVPKRCPAISCCC